MKNKYLESSMAKLFIDYIRHDISNGKYDCAAHSEGLHCCLDPEHTRFQEVIHFIENEVSSAIEKERKEIISTVSSLFLESFIKNSKDSMASKLFDDLFLSIVEAIKNKPL